MKKTLLFTLLFLLLFTGTTSSQQLVPSAISSSGGFFSNPTGMLSFTTGESSAVETYTSPAIILTQGFQQTWDLGTYITEHPHPGFSFGIYPNPSDGNFYLLTETEVNELITVKIFDVLGNEIHQTTYEHQGKINIQPFDLSNIPQGIYLIALSVQEDPSGQAYSFIQKIQIVK